MFLNEIVCISTVLSWDCFAIFIKPFSFLRIFKDVVCYKVYKYLSLLPCILHLHAKLMKPVTKTLKELGEAFKECCVEFWLEILCSNYYMVASLHLEVDGHSQRGPDRSSSHKLVPGPSLDCHSQFTRYISVFTTVRFLYQKTLL